MPGRAADDTLGGTATEVVLSGSSDVVLGKRYALGEVIGTGTSGTVYEATELFASEPSTTDCPATLDGPATAPQRLAAKVLHAHISHDSVARAAFVREAGAAARVQHPGLVSVLDVGEDDIAGEPVVWMIMVRAPGVPLTQVVASQALGLAAALEITSHVLDALAAAHGAGLVHRDVSPGNVMVQLTGSGGPVSQDASGQRTVSAGQVASGERTVSVGQVVSGERTVSVGQVVSGERTVSVGQVVAVTLLDMGLARAQGIHALGGAADPLGGSEARGVPLVTGTPAYMSPEQARGLPVDARGDVYAVGALLYFMLTGHAPFERSDSAAVLRAHVEAPVPVPSARADVPYAVDRLVSHAMAKSPDRRFASAAEMRAAVDEVLADVLQSVANRLSATGTRVLPAASSMAARTTLIGRTPAVVGGALVRLDSSDLRSRQGVPTGAASIGAGSGATSGRTGEVWRPPEEPPARWSGTAIVVLLICALAGVGWLAARGESALSALPGDPPTQATVSPSATATSRRADKVPPSTPAPQTVVPTISKPAALPEIVPPVVVPSLASLGIEQARTRLEGAGLLLGKVSRQDSAEPAGTVLASDPATGQPVTRGSSIRLTVASGRNVVPSVQGLELAQAIAAVESMGLVPLPVAAPDPSVPPGYVVREKPASGTRLVLGSAVTLLVSDGPPAAAGPDPVPTSTAPAPLP
jgi:serine/threonine-protein kinase